MLEGPGSVFSTLLADLFIVTAVVVLWFGVMSLLVWEPERLRSSRGVGAFFSAILLIRSQPEQHRVRVVCWTMLVLYVLYIVGVFAREFAGGSGTCHPAAGQNV